MKNLKKKNTLIFITLIFSILFLSCKTPTQENYKKTNVLTKINSNIKTMFELKTVISSDFNNQKLIYTESDTFDSLGAYHFQLKYCNFQDALAVYQPSNNSNISYLELEQKIVLNFNDETNDLIDDYYYLYNIYKDNPIAFGFNLIMNKNQTFTKYPDVAINPVLIAIISTGIDYTHEDLKDKIWVNPNEIPGNQIDDDHNGYIDDVYGCNFITDNKATPINRTINCSDPIDTVGYGTRVAGVIVQPISYPDHYSLSRNANLVSLKVFDYDDVSKDSITGKLSNVIAAINYAIKMKIKVIYLDLPFNQSSYLLKDIIDTADQLVIIPGGDDDDFIETNLVADPDDPEKPIIIQDVKNALFAIDNDYNSYQYSNKINNNNLPVISAPGLSIYTTDLSHDHRYNTTTQMSAAYVTGAIGWIHSQCNRWEMSDIKKNIINQILNYKLNLLGARQSFLSIAAASETDENAEEPLDTATWHSSGHALWCPIFCDTNESCNNDNAMQSGIISHNEKSILKTIIIKRVTDDDEKEEEEKKDLHFKWKVSSEASKDYLYFYANGEEIDKISGETDWIEVKYPLNSYKENYFEWHYVKDDEHSEGEDAGWIDHLQVLPRTENSECNRTSINPFKVIMTWSDKADADLHTFESPYRISGLYNVYDKDPYHIWFDNLGFEPIGNIGQLNNDYREDDPEKEEIYCTFDPFKAGNIGNFKIGLVNYTQNTNINVTLKVRVNNLNTLNFIDGLSNDASYTIPAGSRKNIIKIFNINITTTGVSGAYNVTVSKWE